MSASAAAGPRGIFISYRRDDVADAARLLRDKLEDKFGKVYFDVDEEPGTDWQARIRERGKDADAFLAVIGPRWVSELKVRTAATASSGAVDYVRKEIEWALSDWPGEVIPVLFYSDMPNVQELPRSIKGLCRKQAFAIRHDSFDDDVNRLIEKLEGMSFSEGNSRRDDSDPSIEVPDEILATARPRHASGVPVPTEDHYVEVIDEMTDGNVVPWLGASVRGALPDSRFLAGKLADEFPELKLTSSDLAEIAQSIAMMRGEKKLQQKLRELIDTHSEPINVHRFLAALPGVLRRRGVTACYQLIFSTNYDRALERAFEDLNEPFDYAIYMPSTGQFVHFPWGEKDDEPRAVTIKDPGNYEDFPMGDAYDLTRTVIVKLHGASNFWEANRSWPDDYVVTEDQYIDYLPTHSVGDYLPRQILEKLTASRCLFLGYPLRQWSARVLLRRIWQGMQISENWWVIEDDPDDLEKRTWGAIPRVELLDAHPSEYAGKLRTALKQKLRETTPAGSGV